MTITGWEFAYHIFERALSNFAAVGQLPIKGLLSHIATLKGKDHPIEVR
jgi:hypothetical protein